MMELFGSKNNGKVEDLMIYLPWELKVLVDSSYANCWLIDSDIPYKIEGCNLIKNYLHIVANEDDFFDEANTCHIIHAKPLLRPINTLTSQLIIDGKERFPLFELLSVTLIAHASTGLGGSLDTWKISYRDQKINYADIITGNYSLMYEDGKLILSNSEGILDVKVVPFEGLNILAKYHFDIFGLIEKDEAIDINLLKEVP